MHGQKNIKLFYKAFAIESRYIARFINTDIGYISTPVVFHSTTSACEFPRRTSSGNHMKLLMNSEQC